MIPVVPALEALGYEVRVRGDQLHLRWLGEGQPPRALVVPLLLELTRRKNEVLAALAAHHHIDIDVGLDKPGSGGMPDTDTPDARLPSFQPARPLETLGRAPGDVVLELAQDQVVESFLAQKSDEWKQEHLIVRFDRKLKSYCVALTAPALDALRTYVATGAAFETAAAREHYVTFLQWRINHGVGPFQPKPFQAANVPEILPGQLPLF
jgi:hypothetical protein